MFYLLNPWYHQIWKDHYQYLPPCYCYYHYQSIIMIIAVGYVVDVKIVDLLSLFSVPHKRQVSGHEAGHLEQQIMWQCVDTQELLDLSW